ncbi:MAG: helicase c2 [Nitrospirae bacterium]|nr:helicase c2 [Nitrospirota bacterium]
MERYFGKEGALKDILEGFEWRFEQLKMAEHVHSALKRRDHLLVEAGTGVGKSFAYLVPVLDMLSSGEIERAVVSTYTKALQRQLIEKDIPLMVKHLFPDIKYALCFGSENYLCLRRLDGLRKYGLFEAYEEADLESLLGWVEQTDTGLWHEIALQGGLWGKVCRESDLCHGRDCRFYQECFYQKARALQKKAHLLVVNHHLFFANLVSGWNVLPGFETVVFDEAHELESVATEYLGVEVSNTRFKYMLDGLFSEKGKGLLARAELIGKIAESAKSTISRLRDQANRFFSRVYEWLGGEKSRRIQEPNQFLDILSEHLDSLRQDLEGLRLSADEEELKKDLGAFVQRIDGLKDALMVVVEQAYESHVYWARQEGRKISLIATPVEPAEMLRHLVFDALESVVLTSATLAVGRSFRYIKDRLGIDEADELVLESPFNYRENMILYIPRDMPEPSAEDYVPSMARELQSILEITRGRTLVLFTSYSMLEEMKNMIRIPDINILCQGDAESYSLIERFKASEDSVLFGTYTFWQGIDLPGEQLKCVVITKLPFSVPTEPVIEARMEYLALRGIDPFMNYQVPEAIITFKQGFGRLIRRASDTGVVSVLDSRVLRRQYGRAFLESIPDVPVTHRLQDIRAFLTGKMQGSNHPFAL